MKEIVQKEAEILHKKAQEVPVQDITSDNTKSLIKDMFDALKDKENGVALAAPQIGTLLRVFVVADKVFEEDEDNEHLIYINPKIIKTSKKNEDLQEACLSVDGYYGTVKRASQATVEAYDEQGAKFTRGASGLLAQIFQHEIDHLNGILYIDHASNIKKITEEDKKPHE